VKRVFDVFFAGLGSVVLLPLFCFIGVLVLLDSKGGVFYRQLRVGKNEVQFKLLKFRTMKPKSDHGSLITVGQRDQRITRIGYYLRKYKLDELPQLVNVLLGDMSLVGPRPEVMHYVNHYTPEQRKVLSVKPGITDYASLKYFDESKLLGQSEDPEKTYLEEIMPEKIRINLQYIASHGVLTDVKIILLTLFKIFR
jgi:lipopolysaccharide/colanic/teichoic acid biosynthesis glycosyltransferase